MYKSVDKEATAWNEGSSGPMVVRTQKKIIFQDEKNYIVDAYFDAWQQWGGHSAYLPVRCANFDGNKQFHLRPNDWFGIDLPQQAEPDAIDSYGAIYYIGADGFHERVRSILPEVAAAILEISVDYMRQEFALPPEGNDPVARLIFEFFDGLELT